MVRKTIELAKKNGVTAIVEQQFEIGARIAAAGLVPILEPEVDIKSPHKNEAEHLLRAVFDPTGDGGDIAEDTVLQVLPQTLVELEMIPNLSAVADLIDGIAKRTP